MQQPGRGASLPASDGASAVFQAFAIIARQPELWPWALVPAVLCALLESAFIALAVFVVQPEVIELLPEATTFWTRVAAAAASVFVVLGTAFVGYFVALLLAPPLSAPALEHLVARVEREIGAPPRAPIGIVREFVSGFRAMLGAALVGTPILVLLTIVEFFAPPTSVVTVPLKLLVSSLLIAWGLFDYPLSLRGVGFRDRFQLMADHFPAVLGFGLTFAVIFWVPCCGILFLPVGAAAGTIVVSRILVLSPRGLGGQAS